MYEYFNRNNRNIKYGVFIEINHHTFLISFLSHWKNNHKSTLHLTYFSLYVSPSLKAMDGRGPAPRSPHTPLCSRIFSRCLALHCKLTDGGCALERSFVAAKRLENRLNGGQTALGH